MKKYAHFLTITSLLCNFFLHAGSEFDHLPSTVKQTLENCHRMVDIEGEPSTIVGGHVNAITGNFIEREVDIVIPGATPFEIVRKSSRGEKYEHSNYLSHLNLSCFDKVVAETSSKEPDIVISNYDERGGRSTYLIKQDKKKNVKTLPYYVKQLDSGITNTMDGAISPRNYRPNSHAIYNPETKALFIKTPYGSDKIFRMGHSRSEYHLDTEIFRSGLRSKYEYKNGKWDFQKDPMLALTRKALINKAGQETAFVLVDSLSCNELKINKKLYLWASNGTHVGYEFTTNFPGHQDKEFRLHHVIKPNGVENWYEWHTESRTPTYKLWPEGRYVGLKTYKTGTNHVAGHSIDVRLYSDPRFGRVKLLEGPVGATHDGIMTHEFIYHYRKQENVVTHTEVKDCYGNKTIYKFDSQKRIRSITPYRGINEYVSDKVYWSEFGGLLAIRAIETNDEVLLCTQYQYDYNTGCPLGITYYGNLTGRGTSPIKIKDKKKVESEGERHTITSAYTLDRYHLKIEENDGQKIIKYRHYPDSDLVEAKFICSLDGTIRERSFFEYDVNAAVTLEINDDGSSQNREDLTAVTTRYIKRIQTSQVIPFGLPVDIKSYYFDLATGQERLLQHETRSYDRRGNLLQSDAYDADDQYIGTTHREYDNRNNLLVTRDIIGRETTQGYDGNNNLTHEKKPGCALTTREYDFSNRLIAEKVHLDNGMILTQRYQYDYLSRKTAEIDPQGQITRFAYDFLGRLVSSTQPTGEVSRIAYNKLSQPIEMIDGQGRKLCVEYTCRHKPTRMDYPNGTSEKWYYTLTGLLEEHIGITGIRTVYEYDYKSRCTRKTIHSATNADTLQHTWNYNAFHLLSETDATGITTTYEYDGAGRLVSTKSNGIEIRNEYNAKGLIFRTTEETEESHVTIQVRDYDKVGRVVEEREEDAQGITLKRVRFAYDDQNHVIEKITEGNEVYRIEKTQYGPLGEILSQIDAEGNETRSVMDYQFYDETGRIVRREQKIDPQGNITEIRSDCKGKPIRTKFFNSMGVLLKESFNHYDSAENLILLEEYITTQGDNPRKVITKWEYDWFNRPTSRTDAVGTPEQKRTEICYNNYGQKECVIKPDGANIHFNYDGLGRLAKVESTDQTIQYQLFYDERGRLICVDEDNHSNYRQYDERNNLIGETLGNGLHIGCQYDAKGRPTLLQLPDRSTVAYQYDNHCLLKIQRYDEENNLKYQHDYLTFNADDKPLTMQLPANAGTVQAKYDALGRTVHIGHPKWNETIPQGGYDSIGNLKTLNIEDAEGTKTYNYAYDAQKQLIKENDHEYLWDSQYNCVRKDGVDQQHNDLNQLLSNGIENYQYDLNGNLLNKGNVAFSYDALDRLIKVESAELRFEYQYDFQNRRIAKRKYRNDDSQWTLHEQEKYIYVGDQEIGACNAENQIMQLRILGVGLGAEIGATIAIEVDDRIYAPVHNHIGHIMALIDTETGDVAQTYRYTAFGDELTQDVVNNPWKFASKRKDAETGFYNFGRRYYSPDMMRWLTADPIDRKGGPNIYAYVLNAPLTSFDLYGFVPMATLIDKNDFKQMTKLEQLKANMGIPIGGVSFLSMVIDIASAMKSVTYNILTGTIQAGYGIGKIVGNVYRATEKFSTSSEGFTQVVGYESPNFIYLFHNGICNSYEEAKATGDMISALGGNVALTVISQRTSGIIWDLFEVALLKMGFKTPSVYAAYNKMKEALDSNPEKMLAIFAHSKGTEIMYQAMKMLSEEERGRIHFAGFGGARMVEKGFCGSVKNYVSRHDSVPFLADPLAHLNSEKYEIDYRNTDASYLIDHAISSETYKECIKEQIKLLNKVGL